MANLDGIEINNGDIKLNLENGVKLNSNFISNINLDKEKIKKLNEVIRKIQFRRKYKRIKWKF